MRFLVDAQLPPALCVWLRDKGHEAEHVADVLGGQTPDARIAAHAREHRLVPITKDDDFVLRFSPGDYTLVWLRCGNITNRALQGWLGARWSSLVKELQRGEVFVEMR